MKSPWVIVLACSAVVLVGVRSPSGLTVADEPMVRVAQGQARGRAAGRGAVFKGLPFAKAPAGENRWREPQPADAWAGVREAGQFAAPCAQADARWNHLAASTGSEDCLTVNIWAPAWPPAAKRPVMVWVHGGANMGGSALGAGGIEPPFDGDRLSARGVVVVTLQYRLGLLGFLAHPQLSRESSHHVSGNYGLLDQLAALGWVQANIAQFGGDPANVTIFGQSAGAHDIGLLMTSPLAKGLFVRAIAESGTVMIDGKLTPSMAEKEQAGLAFAGKLGLGDHPSLAALRSVSAEDILKAGPAYGAGGGARPEPVVDGYVLPKLPAAAFKAGEQMRVPLLIGSNGRERSLAGGAEAARKAIADYYGARAPQALQAYGLGGGATSPAANAAWGDTGAQFVTDTMFRCAAGLIADWHSRVAPVYRYEFTRGAEPQGASHSMELRYVFGVFPPDDRSDEATRLSDAVQDYWVAFASGGDPSTAPRPRWPKYDAAGGAYLELAATGPVARAKLRPEACAVFASALALP